MPRLVSTFRTKSMDQKREYLILIEYNLIIEYYGGKFNVDELIAFKQHIAKDKDFNPNYNIIHDFRDIKFMLGPRDVAKYVKLLNDDPKYVGTRKSTMVTATPNQVAASIGFDLLKDDLPISVKVCSTLETAFAFTEVPLSDRNTIEDYFLKLKNRKS